MPGRPYRRLAAIVTADVAGYSRLIGLDEEGTLDALRAVRRDLVAPLLSEFGGRVANTAGDSLLLEFTSVVDAVRCALAIQWAMVERGADLPEDRRLLFRIGIHVGDVVVEGGDLLGDGVNVAARLEGLAEAGGIALSDDAYRQIAHRLDAPWREAGEHALKNIARPVRVWRWSVPMTGAKAQLQPPAPTPARIPLALPDRPSIAVLPFENLSRDPEEEYFADGITEDLITALTKFRWFFVVARNSSFAYKGMSVTVAEITRELGVRYLLKGSVRRAGDRVRVAAQLIDGQTGNHVWAERYDRRLVDIFELQDEITERLVGEIEPELSDAERLRAGRKPPDSLDAWDYFQRAQWHYWRWTRADAVEAEKLLRRAIELDPTFSPAHAILALVNLVYVLYNWVDNPEQAIGRAQEAAQRAIALDDKDALGHLGLGRVYTFRADFDSAIAELKKSLELNPNLARAHFGLGLALHWAGQAEEALSHYHWAIRQSPRDPLRWAFENGIGSAYIVLGKHEQAMEWCRAAATHPDCSFWPHVNLAVIHDHFGQHGDAKTAIDAALSKRPNLTVKAIAGMLRGMNPRYKEAFLNKLRKAGLPE